MNTRIRLNVSFGSRLLHHISPFQFVDSPEWYATQNAFPHDLKASKPQVYIGFFFCSLFSTLSIIHALLAPSEKNPLN